MVVQWCSATMGCSRIAWVVGLSLGLGSIISTMSVLSSLEMGATQKEVVGEMLMEHGE